MKIEIKETNKYFINNKGSREIVLENINLSIEEGNFLCLLGPSGCGKSTLLNLMSGFEKATSGEVLIEGVPVSDPNPKYQMLFQGCDLFPWRTVRGNVEYGLEAKGLPAGERKGIVQEYVNLVGLTHCMEAFPHQLSGGMQQRVAIARALAVDPEILFMDEPFAALDAFTRYKMQEEITRIWQENKKTIVFVTHDIDEAIYLADSVLVLSTNPGRIQEVLPVDIGRPRDRTDYDFINIRKQIFTALSLQREEMVEYYL